MRLLVGGWQLSSHLSPLQAGLSGRCPECGQGRIFAKLLTLVDACPVCGLNIKQHDNGDGPAFFVIILVGMVVCALAAFVELKYAPPFWLHAVLWAPLILFLSIFLLRFFKAVLLASQVKHKLLGEG